MNDPELQEWLDALANIISEDASYRASFVLGKLASKLNELGTIPNYNLTTPKNEGFESREFLPLSLSYNHRVINGVYAAQFITQLGTALGDAELMEKKFK